MINNISYDQDPRNLSKYLFLDRDGVINMKPGEHDYVKKWNEFIFVEGIGDYLCKYQNNGFKIIIITNQRGISRGLFTIEDFKIISDEMVRRLNEMGVLIQAIYYCPHGEQDMCTCRKPKPGLILEAINNYKIDTSKSVVIGDSIGDIKAGRAAKIGTLILLKTNSQKILNTIKI